MTKVRGLGEVVIWVHDMDKALHSTARCWAWRRCRRRTSAARSSFRPGNPPSAAPSRLCSCHCRPTRLPSWTIANSGLCTLGLELAAEHFEAERSRLEGLGYEVRLREHPFLPLKGIYLDDPDGNEVELIASRS
jgi:hypothetical protein